MPFLQFGDFLDKNSWIVALFLIACTFFVWRAYRRSKAEKPIPKKEKVITAQTFDLSPPTAEADNTKKIELIPIVKKPKPVKQVKPAEVIAEPAPAPKSFEEPIEEPILIDPKDTLAEVIYFKDKQGKFRFKIRTTKTFETLAYSGPFVTTARRDKAIEHVQRCVHSFVERTLQPPVGAVRAITPVYEVFRDEYNKFRLRLVFSAGQIMLTGRPHILIDGAFFDIKLLKFALSNGLLLQIKHS